MQSLVNGGRSLEEVHSKSTLVTALKRLTILPGDARIAYAMDDLKTVVKIWVKTSFWRNQSSQISQWYYSIIEI